MGSRFHSIALVTLALGLTCCKLNPVPVPPLPVFPDASVTVDAGPTPDQDLDAYPRADVAGKVCMWLDYLKCPEAHPEVGPCDEAVRSLLKIGTFENKDAQCVVLSRTKVDVRKCHVDCK